jgi:hypothetical protein
MSRKDIGKLVEKVLINPLAPASPAAPEVFNYIHVLRSRMSRLLAPSKSSEEAA